MAILSKKDILAKQDLPKEIVSVPEWGGEVYIRALSAGELDRYQTSMLQQRHGKSQDVNLENIRSKLVVLTAVDEDGNRLFDDRDAKALSEKSGAAINKLFTVAQRLSGISNQEVTEMAGELAADPFDGSPSV